MPLLMFNGIGGSIELLTPIARAMPEREVLTFDIPGVGHSPMPKRPYRLRDHAATDANQHWIMDFVHAHDARRRRCRILTVIDQWLART